MTTILCSLCDEPAVVRAERIVTADDEDVGRWEQKHFCKTHGAALVRETRRRYRLVHLVPMRAPRIEAGVQECWDMP